MTTYRVGSIGAYNALKVLKLLTHEARAICGSRKKTAEGYVPKCGYRDKKIFEA